MDEWVRAPARSYGDLEFIAKKLRDVAFPGLSVDSPIPEGEEFLIGIERVDEACEALGEPGVKYDLVDSLPFGREAETSWNSEEGALGAFVISLPEPTYESLLEGESRARQTLAHELIHAFGHRGVLVWLASLRGAAARRGAHEPNVPIFERAEWQADAGGSAFLMPMLGVARYAERSTFPNAWELAQQYRVSTANAQSRLRRYQNEKQRREMLLHYK